MKRIWAPLGNHDFRLLWCGQAISSIGSSFQGIALPWMVLTQPHSSAFSLALALLSLALPQAFLTLAGGFLVDRLDARSVMLWTDAARVLTASTIACLSTLHMLHLWLLCSILTLHGTATALFAPAAASIAPYLVPKEQLDGANSLSSMMFQLGPILGYLPAGILSLRLVPHGPSFSMPFLMSLRACSRSAYPR